MHKSRVFGFLPVKVLSILARLHDLSAVFLAWLVAYWLRFNFDIPSDHLAIMWQSIPFVLLVDAISFSVFGLYRGIWRFASLPDLRRILNAVISAAVLIAAVSLLLRGYVVVPRSVLVMSPCLLILMMGGSRFLYRYVKEHQLYRLSLSQGSPVLILGAGEAAVSLLKDAHDLGPPCRVGGLARDHQRLLGQWLHRGRGIRGDAERLGERARRLAAL